MPALSWNANGSTSCWFSCLSWSMVLCASKRMASILHSKLWVAWSKQSVLAWKSSSHACNVALRSLQSLSPAARCHTCLEWEGVSANLQWCISPPRTAIELSSDIHILSMHVFSTAASMRLFANALVLTAGSALNTVTSFEQFFRIDRLLTLTKACCQLSNVNLQALMLFFIVLCPQAAFLQMGHSCDDGTRLKSGIQSWRLQSHNGCKMFYL